ASMADFLKHAKLKELPSEAVSGAKAGEIVLADFGTMVASLRVGIEKAQAGGDEATAGALTDSLEFYEKAIWMLRAFEA
ncbi:MAG: DNA starvation/stationary phase protection protein, partial [Spirochaetota bacterium]